MGCNYACPYPSYLLLVQHSFIMISICGTVCRSPRSLPPPMHHFQNYWIPFLQCSEYNIILYGIEYITHWNWNKIAAIWQTTFWMHFLKDNYCTVIQISLKFVPEFHWIKYQHWSMQWLSMSYRLCFYQTRSAWSMDQGSNKKHSPINNFVPTVTKFCVMWEGQALPHDTKFGNCRDKIVDSRAFLSWSLIHGSSWSRLIKAEPGDKPLSEPMMPIFTDAYMRHPASMWWYDTTQYKGYIENNSMAQWKHKWYYITVLKALYHIPLPVSVKRDIMQGAKSRGFHTLPLPIVEKK